MPKNKKYQNPELEQQRQYLNELQKQLDMQRLMLEGKNLEDKIRRNNAKSQIINQQQRLMIENCQVRPNLQEKKKEKPKSQAEKLLHNLKNPLEKTNIFNRFKEANEKGGYEMCNNTFHIIIDELRFYINIPRLNFFDALRYTHRHKDGTNFSLMKFPNFWYLFEKLIEKIGKDYGVKEGNKILRFKLDNNIIDAEIFWKFFILICYIFYFGPSRQDISHKLPSSSILDIFSGSNSQRNFLISTFRKLLTFCLQEQRNFYQRGKTGKTRFIKVKNSLGKYENLNLLDPNFNVVLNILMSFLKN